MNAASISDSDLITTRQELRIEQMIDTGGEHATAGQRWATERTRMLLLVIHDQQRRKPRINWKKVAQELPTETWQRAKSRYYYLKYKASKQALRRRH